MHSQPAAFSPRPATRSGTHTGSGIIDDAVVRQTADRKERLLDKAFALAFRGLVYAQIWEDPVIDMAALDIQPDNRIVTIASGGCNALSYLTADPARVTAVDLNTAHVALNQLKFAALRHLPDYETYRRFFVEADSKANVDAYRRHLRGHLDEATRRYWEGRDLFGRKRIMGFSKNIYKRGLLGNFIGMAHLIARAYRIDPGVILSATSLADQRRIFDEKISPVFDKRFIRWLTSQPASLFGLGIPPAQYDALAGDSHMVEVLRARLDKLACDFSIHDNYFAWQAFGRGYGRDAQAPLPPYLQRAHYETLRSRLDRIAVEHTNLTAWLASQHDGSMDRYILLDAQDWMSDQQLTWLWREITRTAKPHARVLFRTAAPETLLPGRVPTALLDRWDYSEDEARELIRGDRSSIYGGLHLYRFKG